MKWNGKSVALNVEFQQQVMQRVWLAAQLRLLKSDQARIGSRHEDEWREEFLETWAIKHGNALVLSLLTHTHIQASLGKTKYVRHMWLDFSCPVCSKLLWQRLWSQISRCVKVCACGVTDMMPSLWEASVLSSSSCMTETSRRGAHCRSDNIQSRVLAEKLQMLLHCVIFWETQIWKLIYTDLITWSMQLFQWGTCLSTQKILGLRKPIYKAE